MVRKCHNRKKQTNLWHHEENTQTIKPHKKVSVFWVTGLKRLSRVDTHIFLILIHLKKNIVLCILKGISPFEMQKIIYSSTHFLSEKKNIILCILKGISPFKMHKIIYFSRKTEKKILDFTGIFIWPNSHMTSST